MTTNLSEGPSVAIRRALLSVSDKTGLLDLAKALASRGVELLSTGGTAKALRDAGLAVKDVSEHTGFPEMMDGRVKTLHPKVHGGLLGRAGIDDAVMAEHGIDAIDLLVLNLYPFAKVSMDPSSTFEDVIENIDIGGPAMLRSAAKNFARVAVATDPAQYTGIVDELNASAGTLSAKTRFALAVAAFNNVAFYDACISNFLSAKQEDGSHAQFSAQANGNFVKVMDLRYGENPHQQAAFYRDLWPAPGSLATFTQLQGKELSYNNIADSDAAWECVRQFDAPACVIVKHANPCGVAVGAACGDAYELAYATDPTSAFGGILAFNTKLDAATCKAILDRQFVEVLIAPDYEDGALEYARKKANVRVLRIPMAKPSPGFIDTKRVGSGMLMQTADDRVITRDDLKVVTKLRTNRGAVRRPAVRLEGGEVRQVERHRVRQGKPHDRRRRRADEPGVFRADRRHQGARCQPAGGRLGDGQRCVLPVPRRHRRRRRSRDQGRDPAGRFDARCRSDRRRRRTRPGDGVHRHPPLPPLTGEGAPRCCS
jgi:phosphoribosylaminoimidazolecarboxamide formyltransferase/IMP cyclohydrolase